MHLRAQAAFALLKQCAQENRVITYGELGALIGMSPRRLGGPLYDIQDACRALEVPAITALFVLANTRLPSTGFKSARGRNPRSELQAILNRIYAFDWTPITFSVLAETWGSSQRSETARCNGSP